MRIQEFRDKMKSADRAALEKIAADLYRRLPKALKEQELDDAIEQMLKGEAAPKASAKKGRIPFDELKGMIDTFLSHVDAGYYIEPNRVDSMAAGGLLSGHGGQVFRDRLFRREDPEHAQGGDIDLRRSVDPSR